VMSAYYLSMEGYRVTVIDENSEVAMNSSFANAGRFCPSITSSYPIPNPGIIHKVISMPISSISAQYRAIRDKFVTPENKSK